MHHRPLVVDLMTLIRSDVLLESGVKALKSGLLALVSFAALIRARPI